MSQQSIKLDKKEYLKEEVSRVLDGLYIPLKAKMIKLKGTYLEKTAQGYYKTSYLILKNSELYFYSDEKNRDQT
jgi:hypothetical protein